MLARHSLASGREHQHSTHQPILTKALLSDFTPARPLFEGLGRDAGPGFPCGAAARDLMNLNPATAPPW